jgi:serine/threonine-protein kinase 24/25/MST4
MTKDLLPPSMELDDNESGSDYEEGHASIDTGAATMGSDPIIGAAVGMSSQAAHSTVIIRPPPSPVAEIDVPELSPSGDGSSGETPGSPETPHGVFSSDHVAPLGAPPAYTGSIRTNRASSAARNAVHGTGTVMCAADLGTGVDTIRPVKKVDHVGSLRLSAEYVGNMRREGNMSSPPSPSAPKRATSEATRAGSSIIDEVILPILQNVCAFLYIS